MAFTPGSTQEVTTGATPVVAVAAPAASTQRLVKGISVFNADTVAAAVTIQIEDSGIDTVLAQETLNPGETLFYRDEEVLDSTTKNIEVVLAAAVTTDELDISATFADKN